MRAVIVLIGVFVCLFFLEVTLRTGGCVFLSTQEYSNKLAMQNKGACRILCLGESSTFSGGRESYPDQLEAVLNERGEGRIFSVINGGAVGIDTDYILAHLEGNLDKYKPDIVTVMMGLNDKGVKYYEDIPERKGWLFRNSRIYRLIRILWVRLLNRARERTFLKDGDSPCGRRPGEEIESSRIAKGYMESAWKDMAGNKLYDAERMFLKAIEADPNNFEAYVDLGWCYRSQGKLLEAERAYRKAIGICVSAGRGYFGLGGIYVDQGRLEDAIGAFAKAAEADPLDDKPYAAIASIYGRKAEYGLAREYFMRADKIRLEYYNPVTRRNYLRLKEILDKRKIKLVCVQYPMRSIEPLKNIFPVGGGVIFVDNEEAFKNALKQDGYQYYFTDMFAGDFGHCTKNGNGIIADNIASAVLNNCF